MTLILAAALCRQFDASKLTRDDIARLAASYHRTAAALAGKPIRIDPTPDPAEELARWLDRAKAILPEPAPTRADLEFMAAVEDFARPEPPQPYRDLIGRLGSTRYADREAASKALESAVRRDRGALRWLFAGRRSKDPEIAVRSNTVLRRLFPCGECKGRAPEQRQWLSCDGCGDTLSAWPYTPWR